MDPLNIIIADDHKLFREGVIELFEKQDQIEVVGDIGNDKEIWKILENQNVDIILMDIDMGETNGIDLTVEIKKKYPDIKILALSMHGDKKYIVKMMEAGAAGYMLKNAGKEEMLNAIETVGNGNTYLSSQVSAKLMEFITNPQKPRKKTEGTPLTDREIEVLKLIAEEFSNPEIAEKLFISVRTVDTHRRNLLDKLGAKNTAGLVKYAIKNGLLED